MKTWGIRNKTKTDLKTQMEHKKTELKTIKVPKTGWLRSIIYRNSIVVVTKGMRQVWFRGHIVGTYYKQFDSFSINWQKIKRAL